MELLRNGWEGGPAQTPGRSPGTPNRRTHARDLGHRGVRSVSVMTTVGRGGDVRRRLRAGYLRTLNNTLNRGTRRLALTGRGPFSVVVHRGRKSGREYRTPLLLAKVPEGFVAELTYGPNVDWLRNVEAAGGCTLIHGGVTLHVTSIDPCDAERGRAAFPIPARLVLTLLRKKHYRVLRVAEAPAGPSDQA